MELQSLCVILPLLAGVVLDKLLGDPMWLPHPWFWTNCWVTRCGCLIRWLVSAG